MGSCRREKIESWSCRTKSLPYPSIYYTRHRQSLLYRKPVKLSSRCEIGQCILTAFPIGPCAFFYQDTEHLGLRTGASILAGTKTLSGAWIGSCHLYTISVAPLYPAHWSAVLRRRWMSLPRSGAVSLARLQIHNQLAPLLLPEKAFLEIGTSKAWRGSKALWRLRSSCNNRFKGPATRCNITNFLWFARAAYTLDRAWSLAILQALGT